MPFIGNQPAESYASFETETFSVSATTNYTLSHAVTNENEIRLVINGVVQQPGSGKAYTASGTTLTLSSATASGDSMYAVYLGRALQTVNPPNASVGTAQLASEAVTNAKVAPTIITGQTAETSIATDDTVLIHDTSAGALRKMTRANFVSGIGGGITEADSFRLSATQAISSGTSTTLTGFSRDNESTFGKIGTGLSESSGIFTMGATGIYLLIANFYLRINGDLTYASLKIEGTTNNSSYVNMAYNDHSIKQVVGNTYAANTTHAIFDCQDTSNYKFRLGVYGTQDFNMLGSAGDSHTYVTTIRLGDT
mgnify:CR=1 FL=1